jgi:hypothetical protein
MAKADVEIEVDGKGETLDKTIYDYEQSKAAICRKCANDATQVFDKCGGCGCWKWVLVKGLCLSCYHERIMQSKKRRKINE